MSVYYNEWEPFAAAWLRELIKDGLIADGEVDERSIADVRPKDLEGFTQCHFFAGIGGWSAAARIAGWSDERPMWTGSPPCQPFSTAGNRKGQDDERHLWPVFFNLIRECAPSVVFGEQVAAAIRTGWFDDLQTDMEAEGYATGMVVLPACSVGSPHKRDRLWYVAERVDDTKSIGRKVRDAKDIRSSNAQIDTFANTGDREPNESRRIRPSTYAERVADTINQGSQGRIYGRENSKREDVNRYSGCGGTASTWGDSTVIYCRDGKHRPIPTEPALFPLADGVSNRVGILRGAGNAIVPQVAAEVIGSYMEVCK